MPNDVGDFVVRDSLAVVFDDLIRAVLPLGDIDRTRISEVIDAGGLFVSPGFINIHIHGCNGFDTMDNSSIALVEISRFLPSTGVTSFLPTTMTMPLESIHSALRRIRQEMSQPAGEMRVDTLTTQDDQDISPRAKILGANVEGPYISSAYKGAQSEGNIRSPNFEEIADFIDVIKLITIAPEQIKSGNDFLQRCAKAGIIVSIGHSAADYETSLRAIQGGASHITHLFNAQTGLHHRKPGIVGTALDTEVVVELIADNIHVHPMLQRLVWKTKLHSQIVLITDSMRACGLSDGVYELGGQRVTVCGEQALLDDGTIAASIAPMNRVLAKFRANSGAKIAEVVELVTRNPATELGFYSKLGSLEVGKTADIVLFDEDFNIHSAWIGLNNN